jgi:hypothetical protein
MLFWVERSPCPDAGGVVVVPLETRGSRPPNPMG